MLSSLARRARYLAPMALVAAAAFAGGLAMQPQVARGSAVVKLGPAQTLTSATSVPSATSAMVKTVPARLLTNARGLTLYVFALDKKNKSACYDDCAEYWPPVTVPTGAAVPATVAGVPGTFGVARRSDGRRQLTYDGAPLYTWIKDKRQGDVTGQGVQGVWWAVAIQASAASAASSPTAATAATPTETSDDATPASISVATPTPSGGYHGGGYGGHEGSDG